MLSYFISLHIIILMICHRVTRNFFKYNVLYVVHKNSYYHSTASSMRPTNYSFIN